MNQGQMTFKKCGHPKDQLNSKPDSRGIGRVTCRTCRTESGKKWYGHNKDHKTKWRKENPIKSAAISRRAKYGPGSVDHYVRQKELQKNLCALCEHNHGNTLHQDHDHSCCLPFRNKTGKIVTKCCGYCLRGLLCGGCNHKLSLVEETLLSGIIVHSKNKWLIAAQKYLYHWRRRNEVTGSGLRCEVPKDVSPAEPRYSADKT